MRISRPGLELLGLILMIAGVIGGGITGARGTMRAAAQPATARTLVIVELFTSEGCSSCPPADQILKQLIASQPINTATVIGLSEHVDYWDRLGWKDPFSDALFSRRQSDYAAHLSGGASDNIYTPQMIVDGGAGFVGSDRVRALEAIRKAAALPKRSIALAWSTLAPGKLDIDVPAGGEQQSSTIFMATTEDGLSTRVTRGENNGHTLAHDGVVRRLVELGKTDGAGAYHATVPAPFDHIATRANARIVIFAQRPGGPINAVGMIR